jgi:hypothetical protein
MFAVATVLPAHLRQRHGLSFKIDFPERVIPVATFDGILPGRKKTAVMFAAENSHFGCS